MKFPCLQPYKKTAKINYLIGGATGGDIREFTFKEAYSIDGGFEAVVECYADYPAENTSGYNHTLDYTYTLTLKEQPDTSRGFVVTKLTFYRNSEPPAETTSYESPADSYDLPAPHPDASNTSEVCARNAADMYFIENELPYAKHDKVEALFGEAIDEDLDHFIYRYEASSLFDGSGTLEILYPEARALTISMYFDGDDFTAADAIEALEYLYGPCDESTTDTYGQEEYLWDFGYEGNLGNLYQIQLLENPAQAQETAFEIHWQANM